MEETRENHLSSASHSKTIITYDCIWDLKLCAGIELENGDSH
jgi:hypothetical protein